MIGASFQQLHKQCRGAELIGAPMKVLTEVFIVVNVRANR